MNKIPDEYLKINSEIDLESNSNFIVFMNFGPYKLLPIKNNKIENKDYDDFIRYFKSCLWDGYEAIPFAVSAHYFSFLSFVYENEKFKGVYYCGMFPKVRKLIKISENLSDLISIEDLKANLLSKNEVISFEERFYNSDHSNSKDEKGVLPLGQDLRDWFVINFKSAVLIDKNTDYQKQIGEFLNTLNISIGDIHEGRYHTGDFENITQKIHKDYKHDFFHSQFIPSDYYGIGIYTESEVVELLRNGLISDFDSFISETIYEKLK